MANNYLVYSPSGLRVKASFYNKKVMVYVEGEDDILFWQQFFDPQVYEVQDVGGCGNFKYYYQLIHNGEKSFIVAGDSDYNSFVCSELSPLIVMTYSHSVENMMYCPNNLNIMIQRHCRNSKLDSLPYIYFYYADFVHKCHKLLVLEVANIIFDKGIKILDNSCFKFLDQKNLPFVSQKAVDTFYNSIVQNFALDEIAEAERRISIDQREERLMIKGHFLTEAIRLLVDGHIKKMSTKNPHISGDNLYASLVECAKICQPICMERKYIFDQICRAEKVLDLST